MISKKKIVRFVSTTFLLLVFLAEAIMAQVETKAIFKFKSGEFIKDWIVCGPFPTSGNQNLYTDFLSNQEGESNILPQIGMKHASSSVPDGQVVWKRVLGSEDGKLDLGNNLSPNQNNIAYMATIVQCDHQTPALIKMGSNDMLAVWINGKQVHVHPDPRASDPDVDKVAVNLNKGDNLLLAKVQNVGGGWWFYARFEELFSLDGDVYTTAPVASPVPKRVSDNEIADQFSVLLFNTSDQISGPIHLIKDKKELAVLDQLKPGSTVWLNGASPVNSEDYNKKLEAEITLATPKRKKVFTIKSKRNPLIDGTTWFLQGFHVDPVWRDSQSGYQALTFSNLSQHLRAAQADPDYEFFMSEIPYLKPYYDAYPKDRELIRNLIKEGRIETGGSYNQPNETSISGEAFIRNILYGRLFHENVLKDNPKVYQPWDVFGHITQLPQILSKTEFIGTVWERSNYRSPSVKVPGISDLYFAQAPDGTRLLTRKLSYGFGNPGGGIANEAEIKTRTLMSDFLIEQQEQIDGIGYDFRLNALDEKAPTAWMVGRSDIFESYIPEVRLDADGAQKYFEHVLEQNRKENLDIPVMSRDVSQYNEACELSRFDLKLGNRLGENTLIAAEKFSTFANILGMPYPTLALDKAWRQLLYGQHHDGITGVGADVPYLDHVEAYHEALELSGKSLRAAIEYISDKANTKHSNKQAIPILVYNSLNWQRDDITHLTIDFEEAVQGFSLIDEQGNVVPYVLKNLKKNTSGISSASISMIAKQVPSMGYKTWWIVPDDSLPIEEKLVENPEHTIENDFFKIVVDKNMGGGISSLIDKASGKEYINTKNSHPGNELILLKEGPGFEPAWRFLTTGEKYFSKDFPASIEVKSSPIYQKLIITGEMIRMKERVQEITLYNGLKRIDFRTYLVDYEGLDGENIIENEKCPLKTDRDFYVVSFPANLNGSIPVLEDRFSTKTYYPSKDYLSFNSTDTKWTTHHAMNSSHQWMDYSYSVLVNFGEHNSIALGPVEILTERNESTKNAGYRLQTALANCGVTATPAYPEVQREYDIQYRRFSFSAGTAGMNEYNEKLITKLSKEEKQNIKNQLKKNQYAYALVYDESIQEAWFDFPVLMIIGKNEKHTQDAVNLLTKQLNETGHINLPEEMFFAKNPSSVDKHGLAIINRGNLAVSIENDGSMIMALMHTIPWQTPLLEWTHDFPERKTHVFDYAIYPHEGNWQDANIAQMGYDFNNPLIAIQATQHDGEFSTHHSFLNTGSSKSIISAIKPISTGIEAFRKKSNSSAKNGIVIRAYDPEGKSSIVEITTSFEFNSVQKTNMMERQAEDISFEQNQFTFPLSPYSIETFLVRTNVRPENIGEGFEPKIDHPIYGRFWEHNEGAAPLGYTPVNIRILPEPGLDENASKKNIRQIHIAVTNDFIDTSVQGIVKIETPPGLRAVPDQFEYKVNANSESFFPVTIILEGSLSPGFIRASIEQDGITLFDVLEFKLPEKRYGHEESRDDDNTRIKWTVSYNQNKVSVHLINPFSQSVDGRLSLIGPVETWGDRTENPSALLKTDPWQQSFHLDAKSDKTLNFEISHGVNSLDEVFWLVAKLSYFGYLDYKPAIGELEIKE